MNDLQNVNRADTAVNTAQGQHGQDRLQLHIFFKNLL